jgi:hypothetical protein
MGSFICIMRVHNLPALILALFGTLEMFTLIFMIKFGLNITQNRINLIEQTLASITSKQKC